MPSTSSAPAATAPARSTSRRPPRSSSRRCGVPVAKHGNRAAVVAIGRRGVLAALGVKLDLDAGADRPLHPRGRHRLHVRAGASPGDEACRPDAHGDGHAHDVQPARPAVEPGRRPRQLLGVFAGNGSSRSPQRSSPTGHHGLGRARIATGSTRSRPPAPALSPRSKGGNLRSFEITPEEAGLPRADARRPQGRRSEHNAAALRALLDGEARPLSRHRAAQCRRRAHRRRQGEDARATASKLAQKSIDSGEARKRRSTGWSQSRTGVANERYSAADRSL